MFKNETHCNQRFVCVCVCVIIIIRYHARYLTNNYLLINFPETRTRRRSKSDKKIALNVTITTGSKGKPKLIFNGYSFFQNNNNQKATYWLCSRNRSLRCKARIVTKNDGVYYITNDDHNHLPDTSIDFESKSEYVHLTLN